MGAQFFEEVRRSLKDWRLLIPVVAVPVLFVLVFGYAARSNIESISAVVVGPDAERIEQHLPPLFEVVESDPTGGRQEAVSYLRSGEADVAIVAERQPRVLIDGVNLFEARAVQGIFEMEPRFGEPEVLFNPRLSLTVSLLPAVSGMVLLVVSVLIAGAGLTGDLETGRLARIARSGGGVLAGALVGKLLFWGSMMALAAALVGLLDRVVFDLPFDGGLSTAVVAAGVFCVAALGIGTLIAAIPKTRFGASVLSFALIVPQILLSGAIFPIGSIAPGLRWLPYALPLTYVVDVFRGVMLRGSTIAGLDVPLVVLAGMGLFGLLVGGLLLRRRLSRLVSRLREEETVGEPAADGADALAGGSAARLGR